MYVKVYLTVAIPYITAEETQVQKVAISLSIQQTHIIL